MCEACDSRSAEQRAGSRRRKLWEINPGWHCSIVGTCLTLGDLRNLAKKLGYSADDIREADYFLHGAFVTEAGSRSRVAKLLHKLLDRKHAAAIRRFQACTNKASLADAWEEAFKSGDIPGPYWAVISHPHLDRNLGTTVYGDVHMLSHLLGGSNSADLAALQRMENTIASLQEDLRTGQARLATSDHIPAGRIEVHQVSQRRQRD